MLEMHGAQGILEALEAALKSGFRPKRTFYISFGHDEEVPCRVSDKHNSMLPMLW